MTFRLTKSSSLEDKTGEKNRSLEELQIHFDQAKFQVTILDMQLSEAQEEIRFLRTELANTKLDLLSSRSKETVLLEEIKTLQAEREELDLEDLPDLLLTSLDRLAFGKQQQLFLINGIQNSFGKSEGSKASSGSTTPKNSDEKERTSKSINFESEEVCSNKNGDILFENALNGGISEVGSEFENGDVENQNLRSHPELKLELKKFYEFSPSSETWNGSRSAQTPLCPATGWTLYTPTTPTPTSALRPSVSLHNLNNKNFTEDFVPVLDAPIRHQVSPPTPRPSSLTVIKIPYTKGKQLHTTPINPGICLLQSFPFPSMAKNTLPVSNAKQISV